MEQSNENSSMAKKKKLAKGKAKKMSLLIKNRLRSKNRNLPVKPCKTLLKELLFDSEEYLKLTDYLKNERAKFSKSLFLDRVNFEQIVFTSMCKFSLHGSDYRLSWQLEERPDLGIEDHPKLGKGVLLLGCFFYGGHVVVHRLRKTLNSNNYCNILENVTIPYMRRRFSDDYIFQQSNGLIQKSEKIKQILKKHHMNVLRWPKNSKDVNPFEEFWEILSPKVYNEINFTKTEDLWLKIQEEVKTINRKDKDLTKRLVLEARKKFLDLWSNRGSRLGKSGKK